MEYIRFFAENWYILLTFISAMILAIIKIIEFIGYPTKKKISEIKDRLLIYVTEAELALGSETGKLKLSQVYDEFCKNFPYVKKWISLEKFNEMVKKVLPTMEELLKKSDIIDMDK